MESFAAPRWEREVLGSLIADTSRQPGIQWTKSCRVISQPPQSHTWSWARWLRRRWGSGRGSPDVCGGNREVQGRVHLATSYLPSVCSPKEALDSSDRCASWEGFQVSCWESRQLTPCWQIGQQQWVCDGSLGSSVHVSYLQPVTLTTFQAEIDSMFSTVSHHLPSTYCTFLRCQQWCQAS